MFNKDSSDSHTLNGDDFNDHISLEESIRNQSDLNDDDLFDTRSVTTQSAIVESIIIRLFGNESIRTQAEIINIVSSSSKQSTVKAFISETFTSNQFSIKSS